MGPVWEANHVWLIFVLVVFWTAFPRGVRRDHVDARVPLFLAAVGIILRGAAFALRGEAATIAEARALGARVRAVVGARAVLPRRRGRRRSPSGRVPVGNAAGDAFTSWTSPTSPLVGALAVATGAHLAAVFLAADARARAQADLARASARGRSGRAPWPARWRSAGSPVVQRRRARPLDGLTSGAGLACVIGSAVAGLVTLALGGARASSPRATRWPLRWRRSWPAWALAQQPYSCPRS